MTNIKYGPQRPITTVTTHERAVLDRLYRIDGAWTRAEAHTALGEARLAELAALGVLGVSPSRIGDLILLLARGRVILYGISSRAASLNRCVDMAYLRLCVAQLGWSMTNPTNPQLSLERHYPRGTFREVQTEGGLALVAGKLTGDGYSVKQIKRISQHLAGNALDYRFRVILLTPNRLRGQQLARDHAAYLSIIPVLPTLGTPEQSRQHTAAPLSPPGPYLSGEAWKRDPKYLSLPAPTRLTLTLGRGERTEQALRSIDCDGVMSAAHLEQYYALLPEDLGAVHRVPTLLRTTPSQHSSETAVEFLTLDAQLARQGSHRLAHRSGTGRMRHLLGIPPDRERWQAEARGRLRYEEPDALYIDLDGQRWAIEFDNGTYTSRTIDRKLETFQDRGFAGTIWGVSNPRRQRNLTATIGARLSGQVLLAEWWT